MSDLMSSGDIDRTIEECHGRKGKAIAFFPVGCTEQHGPFLPVETDTIISEGISRSLVDSLRGDFHWGYVFPAIGYTPTKSNIHYTGTVSVDEEPLRQYIRQICGNILRSEFDAIVLLSGHGPVDPSLKEISFNLVHDQYERKEAVIKPVFVLSLYECRSILEETFGQKSGQHADWRELLLLVHVLGPGYFDRQRVEAICEFQRNHTFPVIESPVLGIPVELRSVQGVMGEPSPALNGDWTALAKVAWTETVAHLSHSLKKKLNHFWKEDSALC